jgi:hypothetical protein
MKKIILLILLSAGAQKIFSQTVLLKADQAQDTLTGTYGQNLKHFSHGVLALGLVFGESGKEMPLKGGSSYEFRFGMRTKRKVTPVYSYGYDFFYRAVSYYIEQNEEKKFPDTLEHKDQKFNYFSFGFGVYNRFNLDPHRGNFLGTYIDAGITAEWDFTVRTVTHDEVSGEKIRVVTKSLDYVNYFSSRAFVRAGRSRVAAYGSYRITDHFKSSSGFPELPRFMAGIEMNIY